MICSICMWICIMKYLVFCPQKNNKILDLGTHFQIWEHVPNFIQIFFFLQSLQYKAFHNKNLHDHSVRSLLHPHFFRFF
jgi:hypothetical protein